MWSLTHDSLQAGSGQEPHNEIPCTHPTPKGHMHAPWGNGIVLKPGLELCIPQNTYCGFITRQGTVLGSLHGKAILPTSEFSAPIKIIIKYILKRGFVDGEQYSHQYSHNQIMMLASSGKQFSTLICDVSCVCLFVFSVKVQSANHWTAREFPMTSQS